MEEEHEHKGIIGDYTVTLSPHIGRGTFGSVHKAVHNGDGHEAAAKQFSLMTNGRRNDYMCEMAQRELSFLQGLQSHDNIVKLYGHLNRQKTFWIFTEYCGLGNLNMYMSENYSLSLLPRIQIMQQLASAISFMHAQNPPIIHRDIKLENLMMTQEDGKHVLKVTDFGLSKIFEVKDSLSAVFYQAQYMTTTCGSKFFMAPEFFAELDGGVKYESSVDTFAAGLVNLVLLDACKDSDLVPVSVESKREKKVANIGYEMIVRHNSNQPLPTIVDFSPDDSDTVKRIKRIISQMTKFKTWQRKHIDEVDAELREIIGHMETYPDFDGNNEAKAIASSLDQCKFQLYQLIWNKTQNNREHEKIVSSLKNNVATAEAEKKEVQDQLCCIKLETQKQIDLLEKQLEQTLSEKEIVSGTLAKTEQNAETLQHHINTIETKNSALTNLQIEQESRIKSLEAEAARMTNDKEIDRITITKFTFEVRENKNQLDQSKTKYELLEKQLANTHRELNQSYLEYTRLQDQHSSVQQQLKVSELEKKQAESQLSTLKVELQRLKEQCDIQQKQNLTMLEVSFGTIQSSFSSIEEKMGFAEPQLKSPRDSYGYSNSVLDSIRQEADGPADPQRNIQGDSFGHSDSVRSSIKHKKDATAINEREMLTIPTTEAETDVKIVATTNIPRPKSRDPSTDSVHTRTRYVDGAKTKAENRKTNVGLPAKGLFQIFVKMPKGQTHTISVKPKERINTLKKNLKKKTAEEDCLRLQFGVKYALQDHFSVRDYGLQNLSTIFAHSTNCPDYEGHSKMTKANDPDPSTDSVHTRTRYVDGTKTKAQNRKTNVGLPAKGLFQIFVKMPKGQTHTISVKPNERIHTLKKNLKKKTTEEDCLRLQFGVKYSLQDHFSVSDYGLQNLSTIFAHSTNCPDYEGHSKMTKANDPDPSTDRVQTRTRYVDGTKTKAENRKTNVELPAKVLDKGRTEKTSTKKGRSKSTRDDGTKCCVA